MKDLANLLTSEEQIILHPDHSQKIKNVPYEKNQKKSNQVPRLPQYLKVMFHIKSGRVIVSWASYVYYYSLKYYYFTIKHN